MDAFGEYEDELSAYSQALALNPHDALVHNNKGNVLIDLRRYEEALEAFDKALQLDPEHVQTHHDRGDWFWLI